MPDREKIIQGIQECDLNGGMIGNCPYKGIIALLKEQEETELCDRCGRRRTVSKSKWIDHTFAHGHDIECPFCHKKWNVIENCTETFEYCPGCGAKLS